MNTIDTVLMALGQGDAAKGARVASIALASALPAWLAIAIILTLGPGK